MKTIRPTARQSLLAAAFFGAGMAFAASLNPAARSAERPMLRPADEGRCELETATTLMRQHAAEPASAAAMADDVAEQMVIDHMAATMAAEPTCKRACAGALADPKVAAVEAAAKRLADDPAESQRIEQMVVNDPMAMKVVVHRAMALSAAAAPDPERR